MRTVACPFCRNNPSEVRETRDGLIVIACQECSYRYRKEYGRSSYSAEYGDKYYGETKYNQGGYYDDYSKQPIKVDPAELALLKEKTALTAALNAEKKIAADRHKADMERKNLLNLLKETGLDQSLE